jgi:glycosyltransferase involved in cell wall biosynthesis
MRIVVMLSVHNEADVLADVIDNLLEQELEVVALDNGSDDGAHEICAAYSARGEIELHRWEPVGLDLDLLTRRLYGLALQRPADWMLWSDGDELLQAAGTNRTLRTAIEEADAEGYNLVQFDRIDFFMTDQDDPEQHSVRQRLRHYSWQGDNNYRAWRYVPGIRAATSLAHFPIFPAATRYRIHPDKQVLRHYPYRDPQQARAKLATMASKFGDVLEPWQQRYARLLEQDRCHQPVPAAQLTRYEGDGRWRREPLYTPYVDRQPTRDELFTPDGRITVEQPTTAPLDPA